MYHNAVNKIDRYNATKRSFKNIDVQCYTEQQNAIKIFFQLNLNLKEKLNLIILSVCIAIFNVSLDFSGTCHFVFVLTLLMSALHFSLMPFRLLVKNCVSVCRLRLSLSEDDCCKI